MSVARTHGARPAAQAPSPHERAGLERLRALILAEGGLMASLLAPAGAAAQPRADADGALDARGASPAQIAASGPRARGRREQYELLLEAIYEGYLLHYSRPRLMPAAEADVGLLAGDQLYAIGLARLVELGDTYAVAELADTITLGALAHADGQPALAHAVWMAAARAVGWGPSEQHAQAKRLAFAGDAGALDAMRTSAAAPAAPR